MIYKFAAAVLVFVLLGLTGADVLRFAYGKLHDRLTGRIRDPEQWQKKVLEKAVKWLNRTPVVPVSDNKRLIILDIIGGKYRRDSIQTWQQAGLLMGVNRYLALYGDEKVCLARERFLSKTFLPSGHFVQTPTEVDYALMAFAVSGNERYIEAMRQVADVVRHRTGSDGSVAYRGTVPDIRFVDTIGFVCPFLAAYGKHTGNDRAVKQSLHILDSYFENGFDRKNMIPMHAYDTINGFPLGICGWGRGLGWYLIGLWETYEVLKDTEYDAAYLRNRMKAMADKLVCYQQTNGSFSWILPLNRSSDSSITAIAGTFLARCGKLFGYSCFTDAAIQARAFLMRVTRIDGAVNYCQGDTKGIGVYSQDFGIMPFAQGYALQLAVELADSAGKEEANELCNVPA